ncbi:EAL domain-containing protein [Denitratisoma oestradiolicum]|uniref:histidine kinase n=1 Tax=Denitratisoma oestradiolicum TaxID=311182 RepID=A0A6S6XUJ9_9PROT|nr:EAL domain-containing protein [Denitratisoma oestradiolicum]TWO81118.1 hypothetical protein CBW56_05800 [Denitratisoma oestradiolicum]CAB1367803.1 Histidine kinase [Denitratisoma oestradiolicum]
MISIRALLSQRSSFRRQLSIVIATGLFSLALISSLMLSWQSDRRLQENFILQGQRVAANLAQQSRLAVVFMSEDNAAEAVKTTLAFPDIAGLEIRTLNHQALVSRGEAIAIPPGAPDESRLLANKALLDGEDGQHWYFIAPIVRDAEEAGSPFDMNERPALLLGYVRLAQSKATLQRMSRDFFVVNLGLSLTFALLLLLVVRRLAGRISQPLEALALSMGKAERGEPVGPAELSGPRDVAAMAHAFNSMMQVLQEREQELRQSRDDAMRYARLKAEFATTVSHEIRTPLNGVIGTLDMLKASAMPPRQAQLLDLAWESSQYLLELINNILDFSRLEAGKLEPEQIDFDLPHLVARIVDMLSLQARDKHLAMDWRIDPALPARLRGDMTSIRQILVNLLGNAIKFTERGSVSINVGPAERNLIRFQVSDTGIGIAAEHQSTIFDSFTQADTSTTRRFGGSGLGLSICKQLVTLLGGSIGVVSQPGQGSCFWFDLPLEAADAPEPLSAAPDTQHGRDPAQPCRVLVVEDNRTNQVIAQSMLEMLGAEAGLAENGLASITAFQSEKWDIVLMDCNMPVMDGYEATAAIRSMEQASERRTPIIAMTANTQPADLSKCLAAGMDDHLAKPLTLEMLAAKLKHWLAWEAAQPLRPREVADDAASALNYSTMGKLREVLGDAIPEAIRPFIEDMPNYLETIEQAAAESDNEGLRRTAHVIKGAAGNLGADALAAVAREIEEAADLGISAEAGHQVDRLRVEYTRVLPLLRAELTAGLPASALAPNQAMPLVLIVDDDRSTRITLYHALARAGFRVAETTDGAEALAWLEHTIPDVILMDALMPVMDGFTACITIKQSPRLADIPVLMITALEDKHSVDRAFAAGAIDYIPKPIHLSVVTQRVRRTVEATQAERHVRHLAYSDVLTGLANRLAFGSQVQQVLERSTIKQERFAILFLDLDRFKVVNDSMGHEAGDYLLTEVATRISRCVRTNDCVARQGGDEFTILLEDIAEPAAAKSVAQKVSRALALPFGINNQDIFVSVSIGISIYPDDGLDVSALMRHADTAMYQAKRGRSRICFYTPDMESTLSEHLKMETELRHAIEREELIVHYQPVVDARDGALKGMEALVRWQHPERGLVSPADFIPLAEETGLIIAIGEQVLHMACTQAKAWRDASGSDIYVAVNLSARQMEQGLVAELVQTALERSGLPASALVLEITESVLMENARETIGTLQTLRKMGVRLSIDDFGTGYSSLSYLKRFPTDTIKIDRSFIQDMQRDPDATALVTGIIALAHSLRLNVVAEGVETEAQRRELRRLGCDYLQGYLISRPIPSDAFHEEFLAG